MPSASFPGVRECLRIIWVAFTISIILLILFIVGTVSIIGGIIGWVDGSIALEKIGASGKRYFA